MDKTAELWRLEAQRGLDKVAADNGKPLASGGLDRLVEYWKLLSPETRQTLINSLLGGVIGGGSMGAMGALAAPAGEGIHKGISSGVLGAVLGALAGGSGTAAYNAISSGRMLPGEVKDKRPLSDTMADKVVGGMVRNPLLTAGTAVGGYHAARGAHGLSGDWHNVDRIMGELAPGERMQAWPRLAHRLGPNALKLLALPAGIGLGYLGDRYLKGDYE